MVEVLINQKGRGINPTTIAKKTSKIFTLWYYTISATYKLFKSFSKKYCNICNIYLTTALKIVQTVQ